MKIRPVDAFRHASRAIAAQRQRSFLTLLGIAIGVAAVILLTSIGEGIHRFVLSEFSRFGTNVIAVAPGRVKTSGGRASSLPSSVRPLSLADAASLRRLPNVVAVTPSIWGNSEISANGRLRRTTVYGVGAAMPQVFDARLQSGQFLPDEDLESARPFVVLGARLKKELFADANPLGERLRIGGSSFRVIGVLAAKGQFLGIDLDDTAYIPAARALELFNRDGLMEINLAYREGASAARVSAAIDQALHARHGRSDFTITTQEDMLRTLSRILDILTLAVGALGSISLFVGGVGIVTIMTIAVSERTAEIGLLKALGAPRQTILGLFLGEAVALSALGGALGLVAGLGLAQLLHFAIPAMPVHTPPSFIFLAEGVAILIGLLAGVMPARRAAALDPVRALQEE